MVVENPSHITRNACFEQWPPGFLDSCLPDAPWVILRCQARHEKRLIDDVRRLGLPGCMFYERRLRRYAKSTQESLVPLLGCYVFAVAAPRDHDRIYDTQRCMQVLPVPHPSEFLDELRSLAALVRSDPGEIVVRPEIVPGQSVRITYGPLEGAVGVVRQRRGGSELIINLHVLGHSVRSRLPADIVEQY